MKTETVEQEFLDAISAYNFKIVPDEAPLIELIESKFQFAGTKIDWSAVPDSTSRHWREFSDDYTEAGRMVVEIACSRFSIKDTDEVVVIGDSALTVALRMSMGTLKNILDLLIDLPQHTYITPDDARWCICFTMEGDLSLGHAAR